MADGLAVSEGGGPNGKITTSVVLTCIVAASGGLIFGYDIGISGGVTMMKPFLEKFFPSVLRKAADAKTDMYCIYDSQVLTAFTSSLYIAGLVGSLMAGRLTTALGRRNTMVLGGFTFLVGGAVNGAAENVAMLILGRILLGFGIGFTNQATPIYLSEMAPHQWRGALNAGFEFFIGIGVVISNCINYAASRLEWGWRLSLGFAVVPAMIMTVGALVVHDTPSSLVDRGQLVQAKEALGKVGGGAEAEVEAQLAELIKQSEAAKSVKEEPLAIIGERKYRPHLVMAIAIPSFQQLTGITIIAFYAPVLFQSVGFGSDSALMAGVILGVVNLASIVVSTVAVDRFGRRFLFKLGGIQMLICLVAVGCILAITTGASGKPIPKACAALVLVLMCIYSAGFGWSWGPLSWLVPSEIFPLKIRPAGQSISVAVNFAITFILSQTFLSMLCHMKYATFLFYGGWVAIMTIFITLLLPETKGIPLESMHFVWEKHWYWRRFVIPPH